MADPGSDPRLPALVERCYAAICDGEEPDVDAICADAPELTERVRRLLERERQLFEETIDTDDIHPVLQVGLTYKF